MDDNVYKRQHIPCINEQCGSSDALTEYKNGSAHCFACETSKYLNTILSKFYSILKSFSENSYKNHILA